MLTLYSNSPAYILPYPILSTSGCDQVNVIKNIILFETAFTSSMKDCNTRIATV